jgi:hypothetical protein
MKLTDTAIRNARPGDRPRKLFDGDGLYLFLSTTGHRAWRFKYYIDGREKHLHFGRYPEISLKAARCCGSRRGARSRWVTIRR